MKKKIIAITIVSTTFFIQANSFNALITKENSKYEDELFYAKTGEITCDIAIPLAEDIYKNTPFIQNRSGCNEIYRNINGEEKLSPVENEVEELLGTLILSNCNDILTNGHSRGNDIYTINSGGTEFNTQCEMTIDGGGWTLVASKADDGNDYWTWNNQAYLYNGGKIGNPEVLNQDYQNEGWVNVKGNDILISDTSFSKYMIYGTIINNESLNSEYTSSNVTSNEYTPRLKTGSWWFDTQCDNGTGYMRTATPDSDANGWLEGSKGFIWRSKNNDGCNYDDSIGGLLHAHSTLKHLEQGHLHTTGFYHKNFDNDAMTIWIK